MDGLNLGGADVVELFDLELEVGGEIILLVGLSEGVGHQQFVLVDLHFGDPPGLAGGFGLVFY